MPGSMYTTSDLIADLRNYNPHVYDGVNLVPLEKLSRLAESDIPLNEPVPFDKLTQKWGCGLFPREITTVHGQTLARIEAKTSDEKLIIQLAPAGREYLTD